MPRRVLLPLIALLVALFVPTAAIAATPAHRPRPLPAHVFAPYFQAYNDDDAAVLGRQSGAKYQTMAFIQTATAGSCTAYWNGDPSQPIGTFADQVARIQARGGDVIPSFGGFS